ncbi:response regulator [Gallaecimonas pentaromativorans]|uniref:Response regulator receiver domain-containing protein n=1 Tax=Gallaecimonas pentaromativorans TaxID=584787 RepID=A0A3N1P948_9GAMM|nr:response regulator [Gallaecimonas pentaromativorans]ROQ24258.1 response regulator receiver domain-containing protein [Gallaecimonas pentaromativorans]
MGHNVILCDDSRLARNFLARSLPSGFAEQQYFATSGKEALDLVTQGKGDLLFLDLNMPDLDGYQVLAQLRAQNIDCQVIVISGDVQPKAREKVMALGALAFLPKPLSREQLLQELLTLGLIGESDLNAPASPGGEDPAMVDRIEVLREVANVAMGRAAGTMAGIFNVFVQIPVPRIQALPAHEIIALIDQWQGQPGHQVISQGFVGAGICGEVLVELSSDEAHSMAALMGLDGQQSQEQALLVELSSILTGVCIKSIASQLELAFSHGHPIILGRNERRLLNDISDQSVLCIRFGYQIPQYDLNQQLMLLVTPSSLKNLERHLSQLVN